MIAAADVQYDEIAGKARAAILLFEQWTDAAALATSIQRVDRVEPYVPGEFYRRELPCLLPLLGEALRDHPIEIVIVDGYVDLPGERPGLGRHLHQALGGAVEVVGVAKSEFAEAPASAIYRGASKRPLWVSATGSVRQAAHGVLCMHGAHRIPTLLRQVDALARGLPHAA
jgi:deoxyribonuclease V